MKRICFSSFLSLPIWFLNLPGQQTTFKEALQYQMTKETYGGQDHQ